jgi:hypothetical protein
VKCPPGTQRFLGACGRSSGVKAPLLRHHSLFGGLSFAHVGKLLPIAPVVHVALILLLVVVPVGIVFVAGVVAKLRRGPVSGRAR